MTAVAMRAPATANLRWLWLALAVIVADRPRLHTAVVACSSLFLGVAVVQWALWQWVA
jgi:hypothetical protein